MSHVEAFTTGIKIESSDQKSSLGANQGIKMTSELLKFNHWPLEIKRQKGPIKQSSTPFAMVTNASIGDT